MTLTDKINVIRDSGLSWLDNEYINTLEDVATYNGESITEYQINLAKTKINEWYDKLAVFAN